MKKTLILLFLLASAMTATAQSKRPQFDGIPIRGTVLEFLTELQNNGFANEFDYTESANMGTMDGALADVQGQAVVLTKKSSDVLQIVFETSTYEDKKDLLADLQKLINYHNELYGNHIGKGITSANDGTLVVNCIWNISGLMISLSLTPSNCIELFYMMDENTPADQQILPVMLYENTIMKDSYVTFINYLEKEKGFVVYDFDKANHKGSLISTHHGVKGKTIVFGNKENNALSRIVFMADKFSNPMKMQKDIQAIKDLLDGQYGKPVYEKIQLMKSAREQSEFNFTVMWKVGKGSITLLLNKDKNKFNIDYKLED